MCLKKLVFLFAMVLVSFAAVSQVTVTGTVIQGDDGQPAIGATVSVEGTSTATATDLDGKFSIKAPSENSTININYIGYESKSIKASERNVKVMLQVSSQTLDEVVVTGMSTMDKRLFTGATTKLGGEATKLDGVADISRALEGKAAGVSVQNVSGTFGTAPKIRVRGATSIYGNSTPLWVVDGVILEDAVNISADELSSGDAVTLISSAIAGLNADDIESFQILKDGSATSIYGAKAMAGVIVVTTKQGRAGTTSINYTGEFTYRLKPSYRDYNIMNSQEQMGVYREMEAKGWLDFATLASASSSGVYGHMYNLIDQYNNGAYGLANTQAAKNAYLRSAEFRNTDWFDLLFNNNIVQNHAVSISGGTDKGNFYTSFSFMNDPGWNISSDVQRYTFNANATYNLSKTLKVKFLTSDSYRKQTAPGTLSQETDVVTGSVNRSFDINPFSYAMNASRALDPEATYTRNYAPFNIFDELEQNYIDLSIVDVKFQGELDWKPITGLNFHVLGAYRFQQAEQNHYIMDNSNQANAYRAGVDPEDATIRDLNPYLYTDPNEETSLPVSVLPKGGMWYHTINSLSQYNLRATGQYSKTFDNTHITNFFGGVEISSVTRHEEYLQAWGVVYDNGRLPYIDPNLFKQMNEENGEYYHDTYTYDRDAAFFANVAYSYQGKYTLNGTVRYEGSNRLGNTRQARWLPTWNISGAWDLSSEDWFANPVLSHATLKASYSLTADAGPIDYASATPIFVASRPWRPLSNAMELGIDLSELANSDLTYEKKRELNIGADLGFLYNRINLAVDWYTRDNYDLIGPIYTSGVGGQNMKYGNVASMKSSGVEFTLSTNNIKTKDFSWDTDWTFSYATTEVTDLDAQSRVIDLVAATGYPLVGYPQRALFSIPFVGLTDEGLPQFINEDGEVTTSDINFQEFEKLGFLKYEGPIDPPITGGFGNVFKYKDFTLNVFLTYAFGNKVRLDDVFSSSYSDETAMPKEFANRWVMPGDELLTDIPSIASKRQSYEDTQLSTAYNAYNYSTARVAKGDFIRLKEISLTYNLPKLVLEKLRLRSASLKFQATNLWLIYADKALNGQDPEFMNSGGVAIPQPRQFTFTVRFGL